MQSANLSRLRLVLKVAIHQADRQEERLVVTLEIVQHLDHPVGHSRAQRRCDLVSNQAVFGHKFDFERARVIHDRLAILDIAVHVLALEIVSRLSGKM